MEKQQQKELVDVEIKTRPVSRLVMKMLSGFQRRCADWLSRREQRLTMWQKKMYLAIFCGVSIGCSILMLTGKLNPDKTGTGILGPPSFTPPVNIGSKKAANGVPVSPGPIEKNGFIDSSGVYTPGMIKASESKDSTGREVTSDQATKK